MCAANPAGKSCENVLSYCEATLLKLFHFDILSWTKEGMIRLRVRMTIILIRCAPSTVNSLYNDRLGQSKIGRYMQRSTNIQYVV